MWLLMRNSTYMAGLFDAPVECLVKSINELAMAKLVSIGGGEIVAICEDEEPSAEPKKVKRRNRRRVKVDPSKIAVGGDIRKALAHPRKDRSRKVISYHIRKVHKAYNEARNAAGKRDSLKEAESFRTKWVKVLKFTTEHGAKLNEFMAFAAKQGKFLKGSVFPSPGFIASDFVFQAWADKDTHGSEHAGHTYASPDEKIREQLKFAGHKRASRVDDASLRHLVNMAKTRIALGSGDPHTDEELERAVVFLQGVLDAASD